MKPISKLQIFFAEGWLEKLWVGSFVGLAMGAPLMLFFINLPLDQYLPFITVNHLFYSLVPLFVVWLVIGAIAYLISLILGSCILPPFYRLRERLNGAPFEEGDVIEILRKPDRGRQGRVISAGEAPHGALINVHDHEKGDQEMWIPWHQVRKVPED